MPTSNWERCLTRVDIIHFDLSVFVSQVSSQTEKTSRVKTSLVRIETWDDLANRNREDQKAVLRKGLRARLGVTSRAAEGVSVPYTPSKDQQAQQLATIV